MTIHYECNLCGRTVPVVVSAGSYPVTGLHGTVYFGVRVDQPGEIGTTDHHVCEPCWVRAVGEIGRRICATL